MKLQNVDVQRAIDSWYGNFEHDIIHYWEQDDTWFVVIRYYQKEENKTYIDDSVINNVEQKIKLDFVRLFPSYRIKGEYHLSVDKTVNV